MIFRPFEFIGIAKEIAYFSSPGFRGWMFANRTSFAMIEPVPSIFAPRTVMPSESSSTTPVARYSSC